jgi:hypothetical protein
MFKKCEYPLDEENAAQSPSGNKAIRRLGRSGSAFPLVGVALKRIFGLFLSDTASNISKLWDLFEKDGILLAGDNGARNLVQHFSTGIKSYSARRFL